MVKKLFVWDFLLKGCVTKVGIHDLLSFRILMIVVVCWPTGKSGGLFPR